MSRINRLPQLNHLYAYKLKKATSFYHKALEYEDYQYIEDYQIKVAGERTVHIYFRTATINKVVNGLTMVSFDGNEKGVRKFFAEAVKQIKADPDKLKIFYTVNQPKKLNIIYMDE